MEGQIVMSVPFLFTNEELPDHLMIKVDGEFIIHPRGYPYEDVHRKWWNGCFVNVPAGLPKHHYEFDTLGYKFYRRPSLSYDDPDEYSLELRYFRKIITYLKKVIESTGDEPLYIDLSTEHVLSDADLDDIIEINLNDLDFTEGKEPDEFLPEEDRFYRFVCR